jgi:hypothetical protein
MLEKVRTNWMFDDLARPPTRVPFMAPELPAGFVARPREYGRLHDLLLACDREEPVAITTALRGAGGLGKTTLAAALCHDQEVRAAFRDGVLWITLGEKPDVLGGLSKLYAALTGDRPAFIDIEDAAGQLAAELENRTCLIVLDDVWDGLSAHLVRISRRNLLRRLRYRCQFARPNVKNRFATSFLKVTGSDRCAEQGFGT